MRCEHPNVVTVFEMDNADGRYFISMEYLPGENVAAIINQCLFNQCNTRDYLPPDIAAYVVKQAAAALQYLHDLSEASPQRVGPRHDGMDGSNVFISYHGTVKWLNVGLRSLASALESDDADRASSPGGTPPASLDADAERHTDVFSLGLLLWTCLVGERPALPLGDRAVEAAALAVPSNLRADVPGVLDAIVKQALSPDPRERFASPREMAEALDRYLVRSDSRPTPKHLRNWMERSFGAERASLQMQIARGRDIEAALSRLEAPRPPGSSQGASARATPRPRALWSTSHSVFSQLSRATIAPPRSFERVSGAAPDESSRVTSIPRPMPSNFMSVPSALANVELAPLQPAPPPASRMWLVSTVLAACAVLAVGVILIVATSGGTLQTAAKASPAADRSARLEVRSTPDGAAVFVDGEPTGLRTPALLKGLAPGRVIHVRVDKAGFGSQERRMAASVLVVPNDLFAKVQPDGSFVIKNVPAGQRKVVAWSPSSALATQWVELKAGSNADVALTLVPKSRVHKNKEGRAYGSYE